MSDQDIDKWREMLGISRRETGDETEPFSSRSVVKTNASLSADTDASEDELKTAGGGLPSDFILTDEFRYAFDALENGPDIIFVTGRAGTGKSTLLRFFRLNTSRQVAVVAPTGVAALNVSGQTIHSFFRFPARPLASADIKVARDRRLYQSIDILVIDEISMVRADMLDGIDRFMRLNGRSKNKPFGGTRVIMFGDPYQLPPVIASQEERGFLRENYDSPYFFSANVFADTRLETVKLTENFRQKEIEFMKLLDQIRTKNNPFEVVSTLNERCLLPEYDDSPDGSVVLTSTNKRADLINNAKLHELEDEEYTFGASATGEFLAGSKKRHPAPESLCLRKGAHVMFVRNSPDHEFVNGTMGVITDVSKKHIEVLVHSADGDFKTEVEQATWESFNYTYDSEKESIKADVVGTYTQYPLILAWATTIHKSQGKTFDRVTLDMTHRAFAHGQVYVALSRCRTLAGLSLRVPLKTRDIIVASAVVAFLGDTVF